jgi:hypothetical protein
MQNSKNMLFLDSIKNKNNIRNNSITYSSGVEILEFSTLIFDFKNCILNYLKKYTLENSSYRLLKLEELHFIPDINNNLEKYREITYDCFWTKEFQEIWRAFGALLIDRYFDSNALIQKTPTVRIQLPGGDSTSYHADSWYGHGAKVKSFWIPLVSVRQGNTIYMAKNKESSNLVLKNILNERPSLFEINEICRRECSPFTGSYGDILSFSSDMIHGTEINSLNYTRFSFDFRIAPDPSYLGIKPRSNYNSRIDLNSENIISNIKTESLRGIIYSNICKGVSAKTQLMVCAKFASDNLINVDGNESEILPMNYLPVLRHYIEDESYNRNCIVVYGVEIFNGDKNLAKPILDLCRLRNKIIVFSAQGLIADLKKYSNKIIIDMI